MIWETKRTREKLEILLRTYQKCVIWIVRVFILAWKINYDNPKRLSTAKKLKLYYQVTVRLATIEPCDIIGYRQYVEDGETLEVLPMSPVTEFWLSAVNTFGALYRAVFQSVYSRTSKLKPTPDAAQYSVKEIYASFPRTVPLTTTSLLEEGEIGAQDFVTR